MKINGFKHCKVEFKQWRDNLCLCENKITMVNQGSVCFLPKIGKTDQVSVSNQSIHDGYTTSTMLCSANLKNYYTWLVSHKSTGHPRAKQRANAIILALPTSKTPGLYRILANKVCKKKNTEKQNMGSVTRWTERKRQKILLLVWRQRLQTQGRAKVLATIIDFLSIEIDDNNTKYRFYLNSSFWCYKESRENVAMINVSLKRNLSPVTYLWSTFCNRSSNWRWTCRHIAFRIKVLVYKSR